MIKKGTGITLIALVVTIIVLLILAGVSISLVLGNNGILTQASKAVYETALAKVKEDIELAKSEAYVLKYSETGFKDPKQILADKGYKFGTSNRISRG